jgi:hypothetical protein
MALTDQIWVTDVELETQMGQIRTRFNGSGSTLHVFTDNDFTADDPTSPEVVPADFTELTVDGYSAIDLEDTWTAAARDEAGVWSMQTEIFTITVTAESEDTEDAYGIWVQLSTDVLIWALFDAPQTVADGQPLRVRLVYTQYAVLSAKIIIES